MPRQTQAKEKLSVRAEEDEEEEVAVEGKRSETAMPTHESMTRALPAAGGVQRRGFVVKGWMHALLA